MALVATLARQVNNDRPHDLARVREEARSVRERDALALRQAQERLVQERRRVQHQIATTAAQACTRSASLAWHWLFMYVLA
jgi:hypothetical protein